MLESSFLEAKHLANWFPSVFSMLRCFSESLFSVELVEIHFYITNSLETIYLHSCDAQQIIASKSDSIPIPQIEAEPKEPTFNVCGDLNRASEEELTMAKKQMSNIFEEKQVLPSDAGFEYDKRMDFDNPDEESSWD